MLRLSSVLGNGQKLDGGAMFGNVPKALWSQWTDADENNRIDLACRALLLESDHHKVLFEVGIGVFMAPKFKQRFGIQESRHVLLDSLAELEILDSDITDIIVSHLHFDHVGGLLTPWQEGVEPDLLFPNATFHIGKGAFDRARNPHLRDRASFIPELPDLLENSGRLHLVESNSSLRFDSCQVQFVESHGHTPSMMCSELIGPDGRLVFAADLIPGVAWIHLPVTMGYDRFAEGLIDEKRKLLQAVVDTNAYLFFTHDARFAMAKIAWKSDKKRFTPLEKTNHFTRQKLLG